MAKYVNSFAVLDDEEEDDVVILVDKIVKKVDQSNKDNEIAHNESGRSARDGHYTKNSSSEAVEDGWGAGEDGWGEVEGGGRQQQESNKSIGVDQTEDKKDGWQAVSRSYRKGNANYGDSFGDGQWENYENENMSQARGRRDGEQFHGNNGAYEQRGRNNAGNRSFGGERRGYGDHQGEDNYGGDGQRRYRNGNRGYGGDRRGNEDGYDQFQGNDGGGQMRNSYGNRDYGGDRGGNEDGHGQFQDNDGGDGQMRNRYGNWGYGGDRRGNEDGQFQGNDGGDGQMRYKNGNQGYSDQNQDGGAAYGEKRYRNDNRGRYGGGRRDYYRDQAKDNDASFGEQNGEGDVFEENNPGGEETYYKSRDRNYGGERRGRGGYKGRGGRGREYRRTGSDEVKETGYADDEHNTNAENWNVSGGDAAANFNASEAVAAEQENNVSEVVGGDVVYPKKQNKHEERKSKEEEEAMRKKKEQEEAKRKRKEEEEKEAALMTLKQYYEKLSSEKSKLLELQAQKAEVRKVDKDFEKMQLFERKQEDIDDRWSSIRKPKTVKGQGSEKAADGEVNDSGAKLEIVGSTKEKGRKNVEIEGSPKEKGRKNVAHELFKSAFRPRRFGGGGGGGEQGEHRDGGRARGRGSAGDQDGRGTNRGEEGGRATNHDEQARFKDQINEKDSQTHNEAPVPPHRRAPPPRPENFPKDFPEWVAGSTTAPPNA